jgi:hypothetical protein
MNSTKWWRKKSNVTEIMRTNFQTVTAVLLLWSGTVSKKE